MNRKAVIESKLKQAFSPLHLDVADESHRHAGHASAPEGGQSHFRIVIVSAAFDGKNRIERQRLVYAALADELAGGVHALAMTTLTPAEATERH
jgi:BolA protein